MSWKNAFDRSRERVLEALLEDVGGDAFDGYSFSSYVSPIPTFLESIFEDNDEKIIVADFPEKRRVFIAEALTSHSKFYHTLACANILTKQGALTWSLVDAYHCGLLGAKALLSSFGINLFTIGGKTCLVDLWPEHGRREQVKKFENANGKSPDLVRIERTGATMGQREIWSGLERLARIGLSQDAKLEATIRDLDDLVSQKPWESRHAMMYSADRWYWRDDISLPIVTAAEVHARFQKERDVVVLFSVVDAILITVRDIKAKFEDTGNPVNLDRPTWIDDVIPPIAIHQPDFVVSLP